MIAAVRRMPAETADPEPAAEPAAVAEIRRHPRAPAHVKMGDERRRSEAAPALERRQGERRGPLRPEQLTSSRARIDGRSSERAFRIGDGALVLVLALIVGPLSLPSGLLGATVGAVLPYLLAAAALLWALKPAGAYRFETRETLAGHLGRVALAFIAPATLIALIAGRPPFAEAGKAQLFVWLGLSFCALWLSHMLWRRMVRRWRSEGRLTRNLVVVGATPNAERLIHALMQSREANVLGVFDDRLSRAPREVMGVPVLGDTKTLAENRLIPYVDRIVVTVPPSAQGRVRQVMERLRVLPNPVSLFLDFEADRSGDSIERLAKAQLAPLAGEPQDESRTFWKRVQDLVFGVLALIVASPLMLALALAIRLDSPGPVLFRQRRHGFNNEEIVVWKFRTMRHDPGDEGRSRQVSAGDKRVTRVGRLIRRNSLDELPQLINVLKGEMSLVGPRPHAIGMKTGQVESARLVAEYAHRHRLKPGVTGWAAIQGSRGPVDTPESVRRRVELDVDYIQRQSFWLDLYILAMTVPCLLGDKVRVR
jgi:Undecaprenyl-phosphate glucose phosphotransferase